MGSGAVANFFNVISMSSPVRDEYLKTLREETAAQRILPSLITSSVVAMMTVVMSVSFVAIIFVDPISG